MHPSIRSNIRIIFAFIAIASIAATLFYLNHSKANISNFTIAPTTLGVDDLASATGASYDVSYTTDNTGVITAFTLTFPTDYTLPSPGALSKVAVLSCHGSAAAVCINGTDQFIGFLAAASGNKLTVTLSAPFDFNSTPGSSDTISFTFGSGVGIQNPSIGENISTAGETPVGGSLIAWSGPNMMTIGETVIGTGDADAFLSNSFDIIAPVTPPAPTPTPVGPHPESIGGGYSANLTDLPGGPTCATDPRYCPPGIPSGGTEGMAPGVSTYGAILASALATITRDLSLGMSGTDVANLQQFLIDYHAGQAAASLSLVGATGYFGQLTERAVIEFQIRTGVTPSLGYVGAKTRAKINALTGILPTSGILTAPSTGSINDMLTAPTNATTY